MSHWLQVVILLIVVCECLLVFVCVFVSILVGNQGSKKNQIFRERVKYILPRLGLPKNLILFEDQSSIKKLLKKLLKLLTKLLKLLSTS